MAKQDCHATNGIGNVTSKTQNVPRKFLNVTSEIQEVPRKTKMLPVGLKCYQ
jgi:hypothetical protein